MELKKEIKKVSRKDYKTPTLTVYGNLKDLTAGGSRNAAESNNGTIDSKKRS